MPKWLTSGPAGQILRIVLYGVGLSSVSVMIWQYGPLINIGGWRPFDSYIVRESAVVVITALLAGFGGFTFWRRKKRAEALAEGIAQSEKDKRDDVDTPVLKEKMKDALATLKAASGGKADYLYDLPWYLLIGPPGSGKTTALVNSGLKFPLSRGATPAAVAGVGGTRYCDWWFTEDAVLIDTAGRYTTQDSDSAADQQSWVSFLDLLKKNRPRQPINGVIVAISLEDLMTLSSAELSAHANAIRARLLELHERLKVDFPVYALFTKCDLVAGFMEFFGNLGEEGRKQVWGATFQTNDKTRNLVGEVPFEFDALIERLNNDLTDRLQEEPAPTTRVALYGFPAQMAALKRTIFDFLNAIFEPTRYHANATLRGFYFTSGTQEGTPIDRVIGALARSFGAEEVAAAGYSGRGKSFFLTNLINKVIIGEAAWVSTDRAAVRRAFILRTGAYAAIALLALACAGVWWLSYTRNSALIRNTGTAVVQYQQAAGPLPRESLVADRDFAKVLPILHRLRHMPSGFATKDVSTPLAATFGLSQRERLQSSSESAYAVALERMFRPRLAFRLEEVLEANRNNPSFLYEALKVYLMIGGLHAADKDLIVNWMRRDWAENLYPGAANAEGRKALEEHLVAMLDLGADREPLFTLHGPLVEECQKTLARLSVAQRAYELLKSQARTSHLARDWEVVRHGGPDVALVFEGAGGKPIEDIKVPGFFTYAGFQRAFVERLGDITEQVKRDRWVLGAAGEQAAVSEQYDNLVEDLLEIYTRDFQSAW
ncbi:MAG TPA: type VI secretion system membrane subunit TssM, partial [Xanthobacteraceae bacterium]|nr:type VI secretion system membrane subunit TssM [Xanthobacteraceae bacterium]